MSAAAVGSGQHSLQNTTVIPAAQVHMLTSLLCNGLERVSTAQGVRTYCYIELVCLCDHSSPSAGSVRLHLHRSRKGGKDGSFEQCLPDAAQVLPLGSTVSSSVLLPSMLEACCCLLREP